MSTHLVKIALVVALTHGYRAIGRKVGPRWAGLAAGLPCASAVALVGGGMDRGGDYAWAMAESSLLGLIGAAALPLAYARAIGEGWPMPGVLAAAVGSYVAATALAGLVAPAEGGAATVAISGLAVLAAATLAGRIVVPPDAARARPAPPATARAWAIRTAAPLACLLGTLATGEWLGPGGAGLMGAFPAVTLSLVILAHLEAGPGPAIRLARAFPPGNLGMVAFLGTFRLVGPASGLAGATALGYLAAIATLAAVARFGRDRAVPEPRTGPRPQHVPLAVSAGVIRPAWPRSGRRFSPRIERLAA